MSSPTNPSAPSAAPGQPLHCVAPARVNLLGEHTDYTGGLVLPMAIPFATHATISPRTDNLYSFTSDLFPDPVTLDREDRSPSRGLWADYPIGVLRQLQLLHIEPPAFDLHLSGNVPFAAGLSSSASVEVASTMAMLAFTRAALSLVVPSASDLIDQVRQSIATGGLGAMGGEVAGEQIEMLEVLGEGSFGKVRGDHTRGKWGTICLLTFVGLSHFAIETLASLLT